MAGSQLKSRVCHGEASAMRFDNLTDLSSHAFRGGEKTFLYCVVWLRQTMRTCESYAICYVIEHSTALAQLVMLRRPDQSLCIIFVVLDLFSLQKKLHFLTFSNVMKFHVSCTIKVPGGISLVAS